MSGHFFNATGLSGNWFKFTSRVLFVLTVSFVTAFKLISAAEAAGPLRVNPESPRYFVDGNGKAVYLAGSYRNPYNLLSGGAHNFIAYFDFLAQQNHNFTRLWAWEQSPWARDQNGQMVFTLQPYERTGPGLALDGGLKFDITRFNQAYFDQLRDSIVAAGQRGIYVSLILFEGFSTQRKVRQVNPWLGDPFQRENNINGIDADSDRDGRGEEFFSLSSPAVTALQEAFVRKVADTLNDLDNVLYEVSGDTLATSLSWQYHMVDYLKAYEATKPNQHPVGISQFFPRNLIDVLRSSADWIVIQGTNLNPPLAGGNKVLFLEGTPALFRNNNSDQWVWKTFTRGYNPIYPEASAYPGIESAMHAAIGQTKAYSQFLNMSLMSPSDTACSSKFCLISSGADYLVYLTARGAVTVDLSATNQTLAAAWFDPTTGQTLSGNSTAGGKQVRFTSPIAGQSVLQLLAEDGILAKPTGTTNIESSSRSLTASTSQNSSTTETSSKSALPNNTVATPTITPNGGIYSGSVKVTLATSTTGAAIHYTIDGQSPTLSSQKYKGAFTLSTSTLVKAKAFKNNMSSSAEASAWFSNSGASGSSFDYTLSISGNVSVAAGSAGSSTITATLVSGSGQPVSFNVSGLPSGATGSFASPSCAATCSSVLTITTTNATASGNYPITISATGGGVTKTTGFNLTVSGAPSISLNKTSYTSGETITVTVNSGNSHVQEWIALYVASNPDSTWSFCKECWQYLNGQQSTPTTPVPYPVTLSFIAPSTPGTYNIRYFAFNGYSNRLAVSQNFTVTASTVTVATPAITPTGGTFTGSVSVSMQTTTSGASIYYTTDGSSPTQSSKLYTGAMTLTSTTTIKAKAFKSGYSESAEANALFTQASGSLGLVGHWKFDEGAGTTVSDSSGNGNTGNLSNGPLWTLGKLGKALYFDGIDDNVIVSDSLSLDLTASFTLSAWVNPASASTSFTPVIIKDYKYWLFASAGGYCGDGSPIAGFTEQIHYAVCQPLPLPTNTWTHLAATYNGSTLTLYRNGIAVDTRAVSTTFFPSTGNLQIGSSQDPSYFNGLIDEVRVYNRALSDIEIQTIYQDASVETSTTLATPIISPAGGTYAGSVSITMQSATSGASIYYTTDGSTPSQYSNLYTAPINVTSSATVKAKAFKSGLIASNEARASFAITQPFDFSVSNAGNIAVVAGSSATNSISTALTSGNSQPVSFSVSALPYGATATFSAASCSPACSTVLNISTTGSTPAGNFPITITSTGGGVTKTTVFTLSVTLALAIGTPTNGSGTIYYVAKTGSDSNSCAQAQSTLKPKLTIAAGLKCLASADTLIIKAGTYSEAIDYNQIPSGRGSWETATKVLAASGETVTLRPTTGAYEGSAAVVAYDQSYIVFGGSDDNSYGMVVDASLTSQMGVRIANAGAHHIRIQNLETFGSPNTCTGNAETNSYIEFIHLKIHDCGPGTPTSGGPGHGIYIGGSSNNLVERNEIYNVYGHGIHLYHSGCNNNVIRYNYVHNNGSRGILIGSGSNNEAHDNIVSKNGAARGAEAMTIGFNGGFNNRAYNNTIFANPNQCLIIMADQVNAVAKFNNCWQNGVDAVINQGTGSIVLDNSVTDPFVGPYSLPISYK